MAAPEKSIVTGILVKNDDGKFLLVKKPDTTGPYAGTFLPPGGGINPGEKADEAVRRELYEETGVKVKNLARVYFYEDFTENWAGEMKHLIGLMYTADYASGDLRQTEGNDDEFEEVGWFSLEEMNRMSLSPPLEATLTVLGHI